jgi:acyl-CoA thioesterase
MLQKKEIAIRIMPPDCFNFNLMDASATKTPQQVLDTMLGQDRFTEWMGLKVDEVGEGYCRLHYTVKEEMLNGFGIVHGGAVFSAADSAFAFACNSHGQLTVALDVSITFLRAAKAGDILTVEAKELHCGNKTGLYEVRTTNAEGELVALFKGTAYRTSRPI